MILFCTVSHSISTRNLDFFALFPLIMLYVTSVLLDETQFSVGCGHLSGQSVTNMLVTVLKPK